MSILYLLCRLNYNAVHDWLCVRVMISKFVEIGLIVQFEIVGMLRAFCGFISGMICAYFFNLIFLITN